MSGLLTPSFSNSALLMVYLKRHSTILRCSKRYATTTISLSNRISQAHRWENIAERSSKFIRQIEDNRTATIHHHHQHRGVTQQTIQYLLQDCANCPSEEQETTDFKQLGPIAAKLLELAEIGSNDDVTLTLDLYDLAINTWIRSKHPDAVDETEKLLWKILSDSRIMQSRNEFLNDKVNDVFAKVLHAFANRLELKPTLITTPSVTSADDEKGDKEDVNNDVVSRIQKLIDVMKQHWDDPTISLTPNTTAMNGILHILSKRGKADEALSLLRDMARRQDQGESRVAPNNVSYGIVVSSFAKSGNVDAAQEVLDAMTMRSNSNNHSTTAVPFPKPTTVEYTSLMDAWANSGRPEAGVQAEKILLWMMEQRDNHENTIQPTAQTFSIAINAWAQLVTSRTPEDSFTAAERAERILRHLVQQQERGMMPLEVETSLVSLSTVVDAWSRSRHPDATERATAIVTYMEGQDHPGLAPNERTYTALIRAWAAKAVIESGTVALSIVRRMEERGVKPSTQTFNSLLLSMLQSSPGGASEAFDLFLQAEQQYASGDDTSWKIDTVSFNTALNALVKCTRSDAVALADGLLARMMQYYEDAAAAAAAAADNHHPPPAIEPNTITFNTIMTLLLKHATNEWDPAEEIQNLLDEMEQSPRPCRRPNTISYWLCIRGWSQSAHPKKLRHARDMLNRMERNNEQQRLLQPQQQPQQRLSRMAQETTAAYNAVIHTCRFPMQKEDATMATQVAIETFNRLRQISHAQPDEMTYANLFQVLARHFPPGTKRETLLEEVFLSCCQDGLVGNLVLRELQFASVFVYDKLVASQLYRNNNILPKEWQRNVKVVSNPNKNSTIKRRVPK